MKRLNERDSEGRDVFPYVCASCEREFLFRGKHIHALQGNEYLDGKWIEGYLSDKDHINSPELGGELMIDPDTACQCTDRSDKNGKKIFEWDIVKVDDLWTGIVYWDFDDTSFNVEPIDDDMTKIEILGVLVDGAVVEVIGNIFDNFELLEGGA